MIAHRSTAARPECRRDRAHSARRLPVALTAALVLGLGAGPVAAATTTATPSVVRADGGPAHDADAAHWGDDDFGQSRRATVGGRYLPQLDVSSMHGVRRRIGADAAWRRGITGAGVTVAVIDTGVAPVQGLDARGKVIHGPDLSYESQRPGTRYLDGFGHGTHMAGIIAGRDADFRPGAAGPFTFAGVAPDANILNLKVATGDGGADVTQVIAALDWVVQHRHDRGMDVRVVNLAYGTTSTQGADVDPLARAVENAWRHGIVVVAAAGNDGAASPSLLMPARDPYVIAVGAVDPLGTVDTSDDVVADFSNDGDDQRRPDLVAPGKSVVSLRVTDSYVDQLHPEGLIDGDREHRYLRGSGTSQATAVVSGAVALLLQQRPGLSPDQVKALLRASASPLTTADPAQGAGVVDVRAALDAPTPSPAGAAQRFPLSSGLGPLDASRGGEHVVDPSTGDLLTGQVDAVGDPFDAAAWVEESTGGRAWTSGTWGRRPWTGSEWAVDGWAATPLTGDSWSGLAWEQHTWSEAYWEARSWRDDSWLARSWRGGTWEARSWREDSWVARSWRSDSWVARSWRMQP